MSGHHGILGSIVAAFLVVSAASQARADSMAGLPDLGVAPADPASVCTASHDQGGPTSCKPAPLWYEHAHQDCVARGYPKVGEIAYVEACWKGFRGVEYTCCN